MHRNVNAVFVYQLLYICQGIEPACVLCACTCKPTDCFYDNPEHKASLNPFFQPAGLLVQLVISMLQSSSVCNRGIFSKQNEDPTMSRMVNV